MAQRQRPDPDRVLVLEALTELDRQWMASAERRSGLEPGGVLRILPTFMTALAAVTLSARLQQEDPALPIGEAFRRAVEMLGIEDDDRSSHPGDNIRRSLRRWIGGGYSPGQPVQPSEDDAA